MMQSGKCFRWANHSNGRSAFTEESFLLTVDDQRSALQILPSTMSASSTDYDIQHFRLGPSSDEQISDGLPCARSGLSMSILVSIHSQFLPNGLRRVSVNSNAEGDVLITDRVAHELAHGLLRFHSANVLGAQFKHWAVFMLCDRVTEVSDRSSERLPRRLSDWQLSILDKLVSEDLDKTTSVNSVAARCRLSSCHFSRLFKATYGIPFHKFMIGKRIKRAQAQLVGSDAPISQVALDCGFADQSCFTRRFTRMIGVSPASWRKQERREQMSVITPLLSNRPRTYGETAA